jgi:hypothetical protein
MRRCRALAALTVEPILAVPGSACGGGSKPTPVYGLSRADGRPLILLGTAAAAGGMFWFSRLTEHAGYRGQLLGPMLVTSVGLGLLVVPLAPGRPVQRGRTRRRCRREAAQHRAGGRRRDQASCAGHHHVDHRSQHHPPERRRGRLPVDRNPGQLAAHERAGVLAGS